MLHIPTVTIDDLRAFHAKHFPQISTPEHFLLGVETEAIEETHDEDNDGLGYYSDGVKRTLSDEQIAMFRHSEIQDILRERRSRREDGEISDEGDAPVCSPSKSETATPISQSRTDGIQAGRVEKPKAQQWATTSARTKARNKRNRDNYRAKKKATRLEKEQQKVTTDSFHKSDESDEWDAWHQANGPDAQKQEALDLDY